MCIQPRRADRRRCGQQPRPSTSFVDNTIDLPRRNFLSPDLGQSSREKCVYFVGRACPDFFHITPSWKGRRKPLCQKSARSVHLFRTFDRTPTCDRQTQSHEPWLVPRSLMAYRGKNRPCGSVDSALRILLHFAPPRRRDVTCHVTQNSRDSDYQQLSVTAASLCPVGQWYAPYWFRHNVGILLSHPNDEYAQGEMTSHNLWPRYARHSDTSQTHVQEKRPKRRTLRKKTLILLIC